MPFPAGFPVVQGAGGGSQVGDQVFMSDISSIYTKPNGEQWLRSGTLIGSAGYAQASAINYLKNVGTSGTQATAMVAYVGVATDGAGKFVAAYANATNVLVSTDFGATWATVAHNAGGTVVDVVWDSKDSLFVCAGNTTVLFLTSSQTAASVGSAWTARTGSVIVGGTADTARIRQSSTETVIVCSGGTTGNASRSTNGTTWTASNLSSILASNKTPISLGSSIWLIVQSVTGVTIRSTDGGVTWADATTSSATNGSNGAASSSICVVVDGNNNILTSTTGATGSWTNRGAALGSATSVNRIIYDGIRFIATCSFPAISSMPTFFYSLDGISWASRGISNKSWANSVAIPSVASDGTNMVFLPASGTGVVYGKFDENLLIGLPQLYLSGTTTNYPGTVLYVRIK